MRVVQKRQSEDSISHVTQLACESPITESMSPLEVQPRKPLGTLPFSPHDRTLESIGPYKHHEVSKQFPANDNSYKIHANSEYMKFQVGDYVMVPSKQLQACSTESLKMLKHVGPNACLVDFQTDYKTDSIFNNENLTIYEGPAVSYQPHDFVQIPMIHPTPKTVLPARKETIDAILDEQVISTRDGEIQCFLVRWKGRPISDYTWITREELQHLDPDLLEYYSELYSTGSSLPHPVRVDEDSTPN